MKITVRQAIVAADAIASIRNKSLPVRVSYAINKSFAALSRERNIADEERIKLCKKYADKDEAGEPIVTENVFKMTEENEKACNAEFRELLETETDVDLFKFPLSYLEAVEADSRYDALTVSELDALSMLIEE